MSAGDKIGLGLAVGVALLSLFQHCGSTLERIEDSKRCHAMNVSCPVDRRNVIVNGTNIICTCNEDRPKP